MAITKRLRYEILRRDNNACRYCHATDTQLQIDHVVPVALGGTDDPSNLVAACKDCNSGKSASPADAALIAQVDDDAIRWAEALKVATERAELDRAERYALAEAVQDYWDTVMMPNTRMDDDWERSIVSFATSGLTQNDLLEAVAIASRKYGLMKWERWRYFCGTCNGMIRERQQAARAIIEAEEAAARREEEDVESFHVAYGHGWDACFQKYEYAIRNYNHLSRITGQDRMLAEVST